MASHSNFSYARMNNILMMESNRLGMTSIISTGAAVSITNQHPPLLKIDITGATNIKLPLAAAANKGMFFVVVNASTGAVSATFQDSTGGALSPAAVLAQNRVGLLVCDGTAWRSLIDTDTT